MTVAMQALQHNSRSIPDQLGALSISGGAAARGA